MRSSKPRLLVVTQAVDEADPTLGFFCGWLEALALRFESLEVICLYEGAHALPGNVRVHSLGKEKGRPALGAIAYAARFLSLARDLRRDYDAVFVHMNQEYVLAAGWLWKMLGKRVYMWRNHYAGSWLTDSAAAFCTNVFCTSRHSYTAKYQKAILMPVGIDTERFHLDASVPRIPRSILFLARIAPSKRPEMLLDALSVLEQDGIGFTADFVGSPLPEHESYCDSLKKKAEPLKGRVRFLPAVSPSEAPHLYRSHELFVNCSPPGMFDKTLFEAAACGCRVLAASDDFKRIAGSEAFFSSSSELAERLEASLGAPLKGIPPFVQDHALSTLADKLARIMIPAAV